LLCEEFRLYSNPCDFPVHRPAGLISLFPDDTLFNSTCFLGDAQLMVHMFPRHNVGRFACDDVCVTCHALWIFFFYTTYHLLWIFSWLWASFFVSLKRNMHFVAYCQKM
jgi:hypothetical protein